MTQPSTLHDSELVATSALQTAVNDATVMRIGIVSRYDATSIIVQISGSDVLINAAYFAGQYFPVLGDIVVVLKSGASWVVLGALSGDATDNAVLNPSFETNLPGSATIVSWTIYVGAGAANVQVAAVNTWPGIDGNQMAEIYRTGGVVSTTSLLSSPIHVVPGQRWTASAAWKAYADGVGVPMAAPNVSLSLTWYANETDAYPATVAADTLLMQASGQFGGMAVWAVLRDQTGDGTYVPDLATTMRVKLTATHNSTGGAWFDRVIARRLPT